MFSLSHLFAALWIILLSTVLPLHAESWSFSMDNDLVFGSDDKYTGGFQFGWMSDELGACDKESFSYRHIKAMSDIVTLIVPFDFTGMQRNAAISLQGVAVTPEDTQSKDPIYDDVPYLGSTAVTSSLFIWNKMIFHELQMTLGVIGPASGAEDTQKAIHRIFGIAEPQGWDNQVGNRLLLQAGYVVGARHYSHRFADGYDFEWYNSLSVNAGSSFVGAGAGTAVLIGENIPANFISINGIINRSLAEQLNLGDRAGTWGWSVYAGWYIDLLGYFYLYDYSIAHGYDWDRPSSMVTGRVGFNLYYKTLQASLELYPSRPAGEYNTANFYGRMSFTIYVP